MNPRTPLLLATLAGTLLPLPAISAELQSVTAYADSYGDGTRLTRIVLDYDEPIDANSLSADSFRIENQKILGIHTGKDADSAATEPGEKVIIDIDATRANALIYTTNPQLSHSGRPAGPTPQKPAQEAAGQGTWKGPTGGFKAPAIEDNHARVIQQQPIRTASGHVLPPTKEARLPDTLINISAARFTTHEFHDPQTGMTLKYNLFVPRAGDPSRKYPLVYFGHDAGATSNDPRVTLWQGNGATVWTTPANQAAHPAFVLAPQYATQIVNDQSQATDALATTVDLIRHLQQQYAIDASRIYATGQSGGCMLSIAMNIRHPELFAASYLVAGQWDAQSMAVLHDKPLWIVVSQGDQRAYPGMNQAMTVLAKHGAKIARATWNGDASPRQIAAAAARMLSRDVNIRYVTLAKGTVVPAGQKDDGGSNHLNTWRLAYSFQPILDWLFTNHQ